MYQAVGPPVTGTTVRVTVALEVPVEPPSLSRRATELADEFGTMMTRLLPGVVAHKAFLVPVESSTAPSDPEPVTTQGLVVDIPHRTVTVDGAPIRLTYREFELLRYLASSGAQTVSRAELMQNVWGDLDGPHTVCTVSERTVDTHVQRLRSKLGGHGRLVVTVRGRGYRFDAQDARIMLTHRPSHVADVG
ncbi:MAG: winged helix-turn-helix domain-containing protein [Mycobacterium sp.]